MFVQSEKFVEAHGGRIGDISVYAKSPTTRLAPRQDEPRNSSIEGNLGKSTLTPYRDLHPDLKADFVLANPPFNDSDWNGHLLKGDKRWVYDRRRQAMPTSRGFSTSSTTSHPAASPDSSSPTARCPAISPAKAISPEPGRERHGRLHGLATRPALLFHPDSSLPVVPCRERRTASTAIVAGPRSSSTPERWGR